MDGCGWAAAWMALVPIAVLVILVWHYFNLRDRWFHCVSVDDALKHVRSGDIMFGMAQPWKLDVFFRTFPFGCRATHCAPIVLRNGVPYVIDIDIDRGMRCLRLADRIKEYRGTIVIGFAKSYIADDNLLWKLYDEEIKDVAVSYTRGAFLGTIAAQLFTPKSAGFEFFDPDGSASLAAIACRRGQAVEIKGVQRNTDDKWFTCSCVTAYLFQRVGLLDCKRSYETYLPFDFLQRRFGDVECIAQLRVK